MPANRDQTRFSQWQPEEGAAIEFLLRLGRSLHAYGSAAHRVEDVLGHAAQKIGLESQFFSTPTAIFAAFGPQSAQHTFLIRVEPGEINLGKLADLDQVMRRVLHSKLSPAEGSAAIDEILSAPPKYGRILTVFSFGVLSAATSRFLGGGIKEMLAAAFIGLVTGLFSLAAERSRPLARIFVPAAALAASAFAAMISKWFVPHAVYIATLAGIITLLPGLSLTVAMAELSTQHLASGTARLTGAAITFLEIVFGVALGREIIAVSLGYVPVVNPVALPAWTEYMALAVAPLAFTIVLRAHLRDAVWIVLAGALAVTGSRAGSHWLNPELGVFLGALTVGVASNLFARAFNRPSVITWVPSLLLLVPGSVGFRSLDSLLDEKVILGVETAFKMSLMAVALVAGTLFANVILPPRKLS